MTDPTYTHITLVADRSGSIARIRDDAEGAINGFVEDQQKVPGKATLTLIQFDDVVDTVIDRTPIVDVPPYHLVPRGTTALRDAWGYAVQSTGEFLDSLPEDERPANVVIAIVTDGLENASKEYTADRIKDLTQHQQDVYGWTFLFLAANQDAVAQGMQYGVHAGHTLTYGANADGTQSVYAAASAATTTLRGTGTFDSFTDKDRQDALGF